VDELWALLPIGYLLTVLIETPILVLGLRRDHSLSTRLAVGLWLTACTYPLVILVFPLCYDPVSDRLRYLLVAETFAPVAECVLFTLAFHPRWSVRDWLAVSVANLASFGAGS
jgi:hypothetical protein